MRDNKPELWTIINLCQSLLRLLLATLRHSFILSWKEGGTETTRLLQLAQKKTNVSLCHVASWVCLCGYSK